MAQSVLENTLPPDGNLTGHLTKQEWHVLLECKRIIRFHDAVAAGAHPHIKFTPSGVPNLLAGTLASPHGSVSPPQHAVPKAPGLDKASSNTNATSNGPTMHTAARNDHVSSTERALPRRPSASTPVVGFDPVLLEKSDDLVKAEIHLQRQRLERSLRDQVDHRRVASWSVGQAGASADVDIPAVHAKAMALVHAPASAASDAADRSAETDSVDDKSFYTSSLESSHGSCARSEGDKAEASSSQHVRAARAKASALHAANAVSNASPPVPVPSIAQAQSSTDKSIVRAVSRASGRHEQRIPSTLNQRRSSLTAIYPDARGNVVGQGSLEAAKGTEAAYAQTQLNGRPVTGTHPTDGNDERRQPSLLIRAHNLSPVAPQPAHVSPLAVARHAADNFHHRDSAPRAAPAVVSMLGILPETGPSSSESSPQGGSKQKKRGKKKSRRKAQASSPYIKAESSSPLPLASVPYDRPNKRQRLVQWESRGISYPEPRPALTALNESPTNASHVYRGERYPVSYQPQTRYENRHASDAASTRAHPDAFLEGRGVSSGPQFVRHHPSPDIYSMQYAPQEFPRPTATSHPVDDGSSKTERYWQGSYPLPTRQVSLRPEAGSVSPVMVRDRKLPMMGPPLPLPPPPYSVRVMVDAFGREYVEQFSPNVPDHQPTTSVIIPDDQDARYDQPPRAASRRPGQEIYDGNGTSYAKHAHGYPVPRRISTQPGMGVYREHDYTARPVAPPNEDFSQTRRSLTRRRMEDVTGGEHLARPATIRPPESIRHEASREHGELRHSRSGMFARELTGPPPLEIRHNLAQTPFRGFSGHMEEPAQYPREYGVRSVDHYYEGRPPSDEDIYTGKPKGPSLEPYYQDRGGRTMYQ